MSEDTNGLGAPVDAARSGLDAAMTVPQPLRARLAKAIAELRSVMDDSDGLIVSVGMIVRLKGGETFSKVVEA